MDEPAEPAPDPRLRTQRAAAVGGEPAAAAVRRHVGRRRSAALRPTLAARRRPDRGGRRPRASCCRWRPGQRPTVHRRTAVRLPARSAGSLAGAPRPARGRWPSWSSTSVTIVVIVEFLADHDRAADQRAAPVHRRPPHAGRRSRQADPAAGRALRPSSRSRRASATGSTASWPGFGSRAVGAGVDRPVVPAAGPDRRRQPDRRRVRLPDPAGLGGVPAQGSGRARRAASTERIPASLALRRVGRDPDGRAGLRPVGSRPADPRAWRSAVFTFVGLLIASELVDPIFGRYAILLSVIAGVLELVPIIGPIISAVPAVLLAATVGPGVVVAALVLYTLDPAGREQLPRAQDPGRRGRAPPVRWSCSRSSSAARWPACSARSSRCR